MNLTLTVNGFVYGGWQSASVTLGMEQIAGTFELAITDQWPGHPEKWAINPGDECRLKLGAETLITGYVDDVAIDYDKETHSIKVTGRDRTGDLVDCAAIHKSGQWSSATLAKIAEDLCTPFGIPVTVMVNIGKAFTGYALNDGETAFEALERAARMRGVLLLSNGTGGLMINRAGTTRCPATLIKGVNIERGSGHFSHKDRFSHYIVKGQTSGIPPWAEQGNNSVPEVKKHTQPKAVRHDGNVKRYRPLIIIADQGESSTYDDRAVWEMNVRSGRSARSTYTVTGWEAKPGRVWRINELITVTDDFIGTPDDMLCAQVKFTLDDNGSRTELELCRKSAFELINFPDKKKKKTAEPQRWNNPVQVESAS
jgi:prophage tail gpP-like protein